MYLGSCAGVYYAYDLESGSTVWSHDFEEEAGQATFHGDPLLTSSTVITGTESLQPTHMRAFDRRTGATVWHREGEWALTRSDIVSVGRLAVGRNERGELVALDSTTGEKAWHVPHGGSRFRPDVAESPAVAGADVLFSAPDGMLYRVDGTSGVARWRTDLDCDVSTSVAVEGDDVYVGCSTGRVYHLSGSDGTIRTRLDLNKPLEGRLLLLEDRIVVPGGRTWIGAVDREARSVIWERTEAPLSVVQPLRWGDAVITGKEDGTVLALSLEDGRTLWTLKLTGSIRGLGKEGRILIVGTIQGTVYALRDSRSLDDSSEGPSDEMLLTWWADHHRSPVEYVLEKFRDHKWVFLGEYHRVKHDVELISTLIPMLHAETPVRHLAMEFLCEDHTEVANELISAKEEYDRRRTLDFFREQFVAWSYEEYVGIFEAAWRSNQRYADRYGLFRLVGLHPCIDWEVINHSEDMVASGRERDKQRRYDETMAAALESHLLREGLPALVFTGIAHATAKFTEYWVGTDRPLPRMGNLVYKEPVRSEMFFISLHAPFYDSGTNADIYPFDGRLDRLMAEFQKDIGFDVTGTPFEDLSHEERSEHSITAYEFGELFDGYIIHRTPIREYVGVTCIEDWIIDEDQFRHFLRHIPNPQAAKHYSEMGLADFRADHCAPRPDHGIEFRQRFRHLPELI